MIVEARQRGETERLIALAHQIEVMARQGKKLKQLDEYLKPLRHTRRRRPNMNALVIAHLERIGERKRDGG